MAKQKEIRQFWYARRGPVALPLVSLVTVCLLFLLIISDMPAERYEGETVAYLPAGPSVAFDMLPAQDEGLQSQLLARFGNTAHVDAAVRDSLMTRFTRVTPADAASRSSWMASFSFRAYTTDGDMQQRFAASTVSAQVRGALIRRFDAANIISVDGQDYRRKKGQTTVLFMGVDQSVNRSNNNADYRSGGQADFLLLAVIDDDTDTVSLLHIDRDTIAVVDTVNILGKPAGTQTLQLCISHCFGETADKCDANTVAAVSRLLMNSEIDYYVAMNMDGIAVINDLVGGLTVTLEDDFTALDPAMKTGETLTLQGRQAEYYVQSRKYIGVGTNEARMVRQRDYMYKMLDQLIAKIREDTDFLTVMAEEMGPYLTTNMGPAIMATEAVKSQEYATGDIITMEGEHRVQGSYMQFHPDAQKLQELTLALLYEPIA